MPYFSSNFITDAITTDAQSVSGMKPIFTSVFSGASEPAAQAPARSAGSSALISETPAAAARSLRRGAQVAQREDIALAPPRAAALYREEFAHRR